GTDDRLRTRPGRRTLRTAPRSHALSPGSPRRRGAYARVAQRCRFRSGHAARLAGPRASVREPGTQVGDRRAPLRLRNRVPDATRSTIPDDRDELFPASRPGGARAGVRSLAVPTTP